MRHGRCHFLKPSVCDLHDVLLLLALILPTCAIVATFRRRRIGRHMPGNGMEAVSEMKRLGILATVVALFAVFGMVSADSVSTNFEPPTYLPTSVNLQPAGNPQHWGGETPYMAAVGLPINPAIDQTVVNSAGR